MTTPELTPIFSGETPLYFFSGIMIGIVAGMCLAFGLGPWLIKRIVAESLDQLHPPHKVSFTGFPSMTPTTTPTPTPEPTPAGPHAITPDLQMSGWIAAIHSTGGRTPVEADFENVKQFATSDMTLAGVTRYAYAEPITGDARPFPYGAFIGINDAGNVAMVIPRTEFMVPQDVIDYVNSRTDNVVKWMLDEDNLVAIETEIFS